MAKANPVTHCDICGIETKAPTPENGSCNPDTARHIQISGLDKDACFACEEGILAMVEDHQARAQFRALGEQRVATRREIEHGAPAAAEQEGAS